eukprot:Gregarina_sp_Poly_1__4953@NODE_2625_length_1901_cov_112_841876_g1664_i0_p4_GENE_NODE_2625_length_1901_cov_112_841876_g1664_i0NODE_2625_length_1901_cov_112_841876_g1664_i0_p4_ORF_typecomplete_len111_score0_65hNIFK_binding/PF12196_8/0_41hNIFK_binding/PF12196_8/4DNA_Packaging_2/PF11123_8/9_3DNA_Packaging_2/PF11123_8/9RNA_pol_Rpb2_1/PF04563_15/3e02RNA_pol_Rpb2_1/PF04563_15/1_NODE_2625_length_1901_cov_112_841876_g1664_i012811613
MLQRMLCNLREQTRRSLRRGCTPAVLKKRKKTVPLMLQRMLCNLREQTRRSLRQGCTPAVLKERKKMRLRRPLEGGKRPSFHPQLLLAGAVLCLSRWDQRQLEQQSWLPE